MGASEHLRELRAAPGELVAVDLPPGPEWFILIRRFWDEGVAFLPLDHRLTKLERRASVDRARPAAVVDATGVTLYPGDPVDERIAAVVATSGTGGRPKLAELGREALRSAMETSVAVMGIDPGGPWVACLGPAHVGGLLVLLRGVVMDAPLVILEPFDPDALTRVTTPGANVALVPTMLRRMVDRGVDLSRFGRLLIGGSALDDGLRRAAEALGARIVTTYGLTETCGGVVYDGRPFPTTRVLVEEPDNRILVRGPTLMEGYRHDPSSTGAAFTHQGWLRTGDAGRLTDDGLLHVDGRLDEAIRSGGETIWPQEVERVLAIHPKVSDVAVAGRADPEWGAHVTAFVVPGEPSDPPTLAELRDHATERLARFKLPKELRLIDAVPRTASGKIRRAALPR